MTTELPPARTPDPLLAPPLRWGILGPGWIAERFTTALARHTRQRVSAVGSRSIDRARVFADRFHVPRAHGSYESLCADTEVDIVYVSTPHTEHHACALAALAAGKHVLVEKPMGLNEEQARSVLDRARDAGLFAGEAMWTKFLPKFDVVRQLLDDGRLGALHTVFADHGSHFETSHRIHDASLAGGPLLDLGTYPISFAHWVFGDVESVLAFGRPAPTGVNGQVSAVLRHRSGGLSTISTSLLTETPTTAAVCGEDAQLSILGPFYQPGPFRLIERTGRVLEYAAPQCAHEDGLHFSAAEAARIIADGGTASRIHPPTAILGTLHAMDRVRDQAGIAFPGNN